MDKLSYSSKYLEEAQEEFIYFLLFKEVDRYLSDYPDDSRNS